MFACTLLQDFVEPTCAVMGKAYVHAPAEFAAAPESEGNDVFVCDYEYDEAWKRFRKRRYDDAAADDVGANTAYPQTPAGALQAYADTNLADSVYGGPHHLLVHISSWGHPPV
jgi:hypothetical protein